MYFITKMCCLCLKSTNELVDLHDMDFDVTVKDKLDFCLPEIAYNKSDIPFTVCTICNNFLNFIYEFKNTCIRSHKHLSNYVNTVKENGYNENRNMYKELLVLCYLRLETENNENQETIENQTNSEIIEDCNEVSYVSDTDTGILELDQNSDNFKTFENVSNEDGQVYSNCKQCNIEFYVKSNEATSFICQLCREHKEKYDCKKQVNKQKEQKFECYICRDLFSRVIDFKLHLNKHTENNMSREKISCNICLQVFTTKFSLKRHIKRKHVEKPMFHCSLCTKQFNVKSSFTDHLRTHTDMIYSCTICPKKFGSENSMKEHLMVHNSSKE